MMSSVMYTSKFSMGDIIIRIVLMIPCEMFMMARSRSISSIAKLGSGGGRVDGCGYAL